MTRKLYEEDPAQLRFEATVLSCRAEGDGFRVVLDESAFFPEGGGQPADHGVLGGARVLDAQLEAGVIVHTTDAPLTPGCRVTGSIDGVRRRALSQLHTAEHIVSGLTCRCFGYHNVGFHMGEVVTMDFSGPLTQQDVLDLERAANEAVWQDIPVRCFVPAPEELAAQSYRSKKALTGPVRLVSIEGVDLCACCGTHMPTTGAVGLILLLGVQRYKGGARVSMLAGDRALAHVSMLRAQVQGAALRLSQQPSHLAEGVERLVAERDALRTQLAQQAERQALAGEQEAQGVRFALGDLTSAQIAPIAGRLAIGARAALVLAPTGAGWDFALSSTCLDVRAATAALLTRFGGKGGGPSDMTRGRMASGSQEAIRAALMEALPSDAS